MPTWEELQDQIFGGPDVPADRHRNAQAAPPPPVDRAVQPPAQRRSLFLPVYGAPMYDNGDSFAMGGFNTAMAGANQANNNANNIAGAVMQAFQNENDSRVAQAREMRRMQHEKDMEQMRINALLQRLQAQQQPSGPATGFRQDPNTREWLRA